MTFIKHLSNFIAISPDLEAAFQQKVVHHKVQKNEELMRMGQRCDAMYFINKGMLRGYYFEEDKEITTWFAQENEFASCFYSFITQSHSVECIQALEACEITVIKYSNLQELYKTFPETERLGRLITEDYYIKLEERFLNNQFKSAKERYQWLLERKPNLLQRAALGHIAGYLGISQETLSRIRAEL